MIRNLLVKAGVMLFIAALILALPFEELQAAKKYLSLGTGNPGGTNYFLGAGFSQLINKSVPEVRVIAESTSAGEENFHYLIRKKMDLGIVAISVIPPALEKKLDMSGVRLFAMGHTSARHWFVREDSPIKTLTDFKGRRVAVGTPGSATLVSSKLELALAGKITFEDIKPAYLSFTESATAIKDGTVDVGVISAGYPVASLLDISRIIPIRLIPYNDEQMKTLIANKPYYVRVIIPAKTYTGINTETLTTGVPTGIFCLKELSNELAYKMMKALYENPQEKDAIHPQARQWNMENMYRGADYVTKYIPFHPGAIKYLKEKGVWKQ
jgi:TRAP transporter TAXI family solute receptor